MAVSDADRADIFDAKIRRLEIHLEDANIDKMVAEKCHQADKMKTAVVRAKALEGELAALKELKRAMVTPTAPGASTAANPEE